MEPNQNPDDDLEEFSAGDDENNELSPVEQAALQALFAEPFAEHPYVLVPPGTTLSPEFDDYLINEDESTGTRAILIFDSIVDAMAVAEAYQQAAQVLLEPVPCDIFSLDARYAVQYFRANGVIAVMPLADYQQNIGEQEDGISNEEPFPQKPYALIPAGATVRADDTEYIIHKDVETENQCIILFDSIVDAFSIAAEYKEATGREAEPVECDVYSLEDRFWVKFYRANGNILQLPVTEYRKNIGTERSYE